MPRGEQTSNKTYFKVAYEDNNKDKGRPFFAEQQKVGDEWKGVSKDTFLEGKIVGISKSQYEYKNEPQYTFEIVIDGGEENYAIQFNYGYFPRSVLNSIASITDLANTTIRLEIYRNKDGYVSIAVKNTTNNAEGERTEWAVDNKKLPTLKQEKWLDSFDYFINLIKGRIPEKSEEPVGLKKEVDMDGDPEAIRMLEEAFDAEKVSPNPLDLETKHAKKVESNPNGTEQTDEFQDLPW